METGIIIRYKEDIDGQAIADAFDSADYYYEWTDGQFFLEEDIENYDNLEKEIERLIPNTINFWIESI
jgi:hypothetical protein